MKNWFDKFIVGYGFAILLGLVLLIYYHHKTACPNVVGYYKCNNLFD